MRYLLEIAALVATVGASPALRVIGARDVVATPTSKITNADQLSSAIATLETDAANGAASVAAALAILQNIVPLGQPNGKAQLAQELTTVLSANPVDIFTFGAQILLNGFAGGDLQTIAAGYLTESSTNNSNTKEPSHSVYPASPNDAPYSVSEAELRAAIYIPPTFTYGQGKPPVIFLPGTAALAGQQNAPNYGKLFVQNNIADPVYLNIPTENLADIQIAAEYTAYAINYISGISNNVNVSTLSWSAGSLDGQWAFKYWPSTRSHVSDAIRISGDLHGTTLASIICPGFIETCTPAIEQQFYNSTFIKTLRNNGGSDAYVPTTSIYSIFDEIVEPQADPNASAFTTDARGVGVTNVEVQSVCTALLPGGLPNLDHEGMLISSVGYALAVDALTHDGPGDLSRINTTQECERFAPEGLSLTDILATYALIPLAAVNILAFEPKVDAEPAIMPYAQKDIPAS